MPDEDCVKIWDSRDDGLNRQVENLPHQHCLTGAQGTLWQDTEAHTKTRRECPRVGFVDSMHQRSATGGLIHEQASAMRSRKLAVLQSTLLPPPLHGDETGDLLIVGWGSTKGAIEEAVDRARAQGARVSSTHLAFLSPLQPGLRELFGRFGRVCTVELNYSDAPDAPYITSENRRIGQLAWLLRASTLVDVDCWTRVPGEPLRPADIHDAITTRLNTSAPARAPRGVT